MNVRINIIGPEKAEKEFRKVAMELEKLFQRLAEWLVRGNGYTDICDESMQEGLRKVFDGMTEREILGMFDISGPVYIPLFFAKQVANVASFDATFYPRGNSLLRYKHVSILICLNCQDLQNAGFEGQGDILFVFSLIMRVRKGKLYLSRVLSYKSTKN